MVDACCDKKVRNPYYTKIAITSSEITLNSRLFSPHKKAKVAVLLKLPNKDITPCSLQLSNSFKILMNCILYFELKLLQFLTITLGALALSHLMISDLLIFFSTKMNFMSKLPRVEIN